MKKAGLQFLLGGGGGIFSNSDSTPAGRLSGLGGGFIAIP